MKEEKKEKQPFFSEIFSPARKIFSRDQKPCLHTLEWIFVLLAFFAIGISVIDYQSVVDLYDGLSESEKTLIRTSEEQELFTGEVVSEPIDTTEWDTYQNKWYGFEIQHPDEWKNNTQYKTATEKSAVYETIYKFRNDGERPDEAFEGYDVKIYSTKKVPGTENTNDVRKKDGAAENMDECVLSEEADFSPEGYHFQKVSIKEDNPCYEPAYFYSIAKDGYIYNIVPAVGKSGERYSDPEKETTRLFPEFKEAAESFDFITVVRPAPKRDPRAGVKRPFAAKIVNGKLVCAKKKDKPGKSKNGNKPGHMDMECCLDPDEVPNPWCTY